MPEEFMDRELRDAELGRAYVATATPADLPREVDVLENGTVTVRDCISTVLEEEFEHHRYAVRDLATFERRLRSARHRVGTLKLQHGRDPSIPTVSCG